MFGAWELCISVQEETFKFAVCRFNKKNKKIQVRKAFQVDIPPDFSATRDDKNEKVISGIISKQLKKNRIKIKKYRLNISDKAIITRVVKLPAMEFKDLKNFMKLSINQYFPINPEEYSFDYKIQSINENDEKAFFNVFLVAIPKSIVEYYAEILHKCKLKPKQISIYSDVISNLFSSFAGPDIAVLDVGYNYTEFTMLEDKNVFINSIINWALPRSEEGADEGEFFNSLGEESLGEDYQATIEAIRNYLNFFSSRHHGRTIENIYVIGEGALLKKVIALSEEKLLIKLKIAHEEFASNIVAVSMNSGEKKKFYPERFLSCFALLTGGIK